MPTREELDLDGVDVDPGDLEKLLDIDVQRWREELANRGEHLAQYDVVPEEIWRAHRRIESALDDAAG